MKKTLYIVSLLLLTGNILAQHYPVYSQYMFSGLAINPAYTGSRDVLTVALLYRDQWTGIEGSPKDQLLSIHAPMKGDRVALGLLVQNDKIGVTGTTSFYPNFAFRILFTDRKNSTLSFGLKAGIVTSNSNWSELEVNDESDEVFSTNTNHFILPNFGTGIYFYNDVFYAGISVPCFFTFKEESANNGYTIKNDFTNYNYLFTTGFVFPLGENIKIKPSTLIKYHRNSSFQIDANFNFIIKERYWFGGAYRVEDALVGIVEIQITDQIKVGYAYDSALGDVKKYMGDSHEIVLRYDFTFKIEAVNPRYF